MKHVLLLLSALIFAVPAWAADMSAAPASAPAASSSAAPAAPAKKMKARKHKKAKAHKKAKKSKKVTAKSLSCPTGCQAETCGGVTSCFKTRPAPLCGVKC